MLRDWQIQRRQHDGLEIANRAKIERKRENAYIVSSLTKRKTRYTVIADPNNPTCTCPDHEMHQEPCKHIYAVQLLIQREQDDKASITTLPQVPRPSKPTYKQNWTAYIAAQMNETNEFQAMLYDLVQNIAEPERGQGAAFSKGRSTTTGFRPTSKNRACRRSCGN